MRRFAHLVAFALLAVTLGGCASEPRLGSTFSLRTDLSVEEALYARQHHDVLEARLVRKIEEIDPAEIYRASIIDRDMEDDLPYQLLTESITMHVSEVELRHYLEKPDAWVHVTFTVRRLDEDPRPPESDPQIIAWGLFLDRVEPEMERTQALLAKIFRNGDPWISTKMRDAPPPDERVRIERRQYDPEMDGGFWKLGTERPGAGPGPGEDPRPSAD